MIIPDNHRIYDHDIPFMITTHAIGIYERYRDFQVGIIPHTKGDTQTFMKNCMQHIEARSPIV